MALKHDTYSANFNAARDPKGGKRRKIGLREIANAVGKSYEHIRRISWGAEHHGESKFTISEDCNAKICEYLGLPVDEMWALATREKFAQKVGYVPMQLEDPEGKLMTDMWGLLSPADKKTMVKLAESLVLSANMPNPDLLAAAR